MDHDTIDKRMKLDKLVVECPWFPEMQFFDAESDAMIDEKIQVLTDLCAGKSIADIPDFYKVLELMPGPGQHWD